MKHNNFVYIDESAIIGESTIIESGTTILKNAQIGSECKIHRNIFIDQDVCIGNRVKIQDNVMIPHGVKIKDGVFIGPSVAFTNDKYPRAINVDGTLKTSADWNTSETIIEYGASIGANSTIVCGVIVGRWAMIGAGSVVTKNVDKYSVVVGNPACVIGTIDESGNITKNNK